MASQNKCLIIYFCHDCWRNHVWCCVFTLCHPDNNMISWRSVFPFIDLLLLYVTVIGKAFCFQAMTPVMGLGPLVCLFIVSFSVMLAQVKDTKPFDGIFDSQNHLIPYCFPCSSNHWATSYPLSLCVRDLLTNGIWNYYFVLRVFVNQQTTDHQSLCQSLRHFYSLMCTNLYSSSFYWTYSLNLSFMF